MVLEAGRIAVTGSIVISQKLLVRILTSSCYDLEGTYEHLRVVVALDDWNVCTRMNMVWLDAVPVEVADRAHAVHAPVQLHFVALHHLLDRGADLSHSRVDASFLHTICILVH